MNAHRLRKIMVAAAVSLLAALTITTGAPPAEANDLLALSVHTEENSTAIDRLFDGVLGTTDQDSWQNSGNRWANSSFPMRVVIDLGEPVLLNGVDVYAGQIPFPESADLQLSFSLTGVETDTAVTSVSLANPIYDTWNQVATTEVLAQYVELRFDSVEAHFNIAEVHVNLATGVPEQPELPTNTTDLIAGVVAIDGDNSENAERITDEVTGPDPEFSWTNPTFWDPASYPMTATLDLGAVYDLQQMDYFVGNLQIGTDELHVVLDDAQITTQDHEWNDWHSVELSGPAQFVELRFDGPNARFNLSEVRVFGTPAADQPEPLDEQEPEEDEPEEEQEDEPEEEGDDEPEEVQQTGIEPPLGSQPQAGPPPVDLERAYGFNDWPKDHLSVTCQDRHDSYWVQGPAADNDLPAADPQNQAYHTWHPALDVLPDGTTCDYGHEHGTNPSAAGEAAFTLSGGWPAFGYAAAQAAAAHGESGGHDMQRHEDHVGHKVTVATFGAAIGNGADRNGTLYDAGFECVWLSKIHQGSHSLDAFSNHLHEYFLTLMCGDGTEFSVKVMYTYGEPDKFVEDNCSQDVSWTAGNDTLFNSGVLTGPDGGNVPGAHRQEPLGNNSPNSRGFTCASGVIWKNMETQVEWVDLWTELIKIEHGDGSTAMTIQPYYVVKNPARIIAPYDGISEAGGPNQEYELPSEVVRTVSLCYDQATGIRLSRPYCEDAPATQPDWASASSPFNGALRAVHFKSSDLQNGGGPEIFCTDPFGHATGATLPCPAGTIEQRAASYTNHWNDGSFSNGGQAGNIQGSIWSETPQGARIDAEPRATGGYAGYRIGYELIIDNRDPDDNFDGVPDGATILGRN